MNDFIDNLVVRGLRTQPSIQPRLPSWFEPRPSYGTPAGHPSKNEGGVNPVSGAGLSMQDRLEFNLQKIGPRESPQRSHPSQPDRPDVTEGRLPPPAVPPGSDGAAEPSRPETSERLRNAESVSLPRGEKSALRVKPVQQVPSPTVKPSVRIVSAKDPTMPGERRSDGETLGWNKTSPAPGAIQPGKAGEDFPGRAQPNLTASPEEPFQSFKSSIYPAASPVRPQMRPLVKPAAPDSAKPQGAASIRVSIGRVEVRAVMNAPPPARPKRAPRARLSLDEYLRSRNGGGR